MNERREADGREPISWGLGLHAGVLEYGNIGSEARHSWSAIGPVVNETSRLEGLTKTLSEPIVASRAFVEGLADDWRPLGAQTLRGVDAPIEAFAPPPAGHSAYVKEPV